MTLSEIEYQLQDMARDLDLEEASVEVEQSGRWLHVLISARDFEGKSAGERDNIIWREFERRFDDETILAITQCYLLTPEEHAGLLAVH